MKTGIEEVMTTSESIAALAPDLVLAMGKMSNGIKNADNPFFKTKYTPLDIVLDIVRPALTAHNLFLIQAPGKVGEDAVLVGRIVHKSGEWIQNIIAIKEVKEGPQPFGSVTTYLRRYQAMALCGIAAEDDDANLGQGNNQKETPSAKSATPQGVTEAQMKAIYKGLPPHIKDGLDAAGVNDTIEAYQFYKAAKGDLVQLEKLIASKMRG
jgi:hypothetical protein